MPFYRQQIKTACEHLCKSDPIMNAIINQVGPFTAKARRDRFTTLVFSIISQQISVAAAATIKQRLVDSFPDQKVNAERLAQYSVEQLRELGVSRQKAIYVLDLSNKVHRGKVVLEQMHRKTNQEIIDELVQVKGIGVWTAQMFLMFSMARLNVLPVDDLGIKNAVASHYGFGNLPDRKQIEKVAQKWQPYETIACWYLWRSLENSPG
ncbi:MAG: DNA-3-methyladenine glycosylase 2 family protein [Planctomycetota bacterium]